MIFLVSGRMMAPVGLLSILLLGLASISAWYVRNLQRSVSDVMMGNVNSMLAAQELEISIRETNTQFNRYLITLDEKFLEPIPRMRARTDTALTEAERYAKSPQEQVLMQRTRAGYQNFFEQYETILREKENWKYVKIIALIDSVLFKEILEPAHEYARINEGMLTQTTTANQQLADRLTIGLVALGLFGSVAGLLGGSVITLAIRRSMLDTATRVRSTAQQLGEAAWRGRVLPPQSALSAKPTDPLAEIQQSAAAVLNRLRQTERDALRAEQLAWVGQMAAGIAHEIRNPLMSIKLLVQATSERGAAGFRPRDLQILEEEIIRLEQIVSGFLDFARPPKMNFQRVELGDLISRTLSGVEARAALQGVRLVWQPPAPGTATLEADPSQLKQVLFNLLFNALDAQPGGGRIELRLLEEPQPYVHSELASHPGWMLEIQDAGPGIPTELGESIFEPFISSKETGLGLGLSICRRILEAHGGVIDYESSSEGTTFRLWLPMTQSPPQDADPVGRRAPATVAFGPHTDRDLGSN